MTNYDTVVRTFQYMSPEQAKLGRPDIDTRSDVYSLGAVLYELLAGTTPLEHKSLAKASYVEILQRIREEEPAPPSARTRRSVASAESAVQRRTDLAQSPKLLDGELDWITMRALEKDRTRRYETVNGLARDLQRYLSGEPVDAAPPSTTYRLGKFARKHRAWLATAAAFAALLVAGVVVSSWMAVRASRAEQEALAVNDFLQNDLLAQASASQQTRLDARPDPHLEVRTALDRAAVRIEGKFRAQPQVEASIRQTVGATYIDLSLYPEAEQHLERALELRRSLLGENHPDTLTSMDALATVLERQGKFAMAEPLYVKVLETRRRVLGAEHSQTLTTMYSLGAMYGGEGKYALAEGIYTTLIPIQRRVLGGENFQTVKSMGNLAAMYHFQRKYAQAEPAYLNTLELLRRVRGREDPESLIVLVNLAELYRDQTKYAQAEPLYIDALDIQRRVLGQNHRDTIYTMKSLAGLYSSEGKYVSAEALYAQALEAGRRVLGEEHPSTLNTLGSLGRVRLLQRKYTEAEATLRDASQKYEKARPEIWEGYDCQSMVGASLAGQEKYVEAEPLLLAGYAGLMKHESTTSAADRSSQAEAGDRIVKLYQSWGKPEKAAVWRKKLQKNEVSDSSGKR